MVSGGCDTRYGASCYTSGSVDRAAAGGGGGRGDASSAETGG